MSASSDAVSQRFFPYDLSLHASVEKNVHFDSMDIFCHSCTTTTKLLHPFNSLFSGTTWVSLHQKGKPFWIFLEHMQIICTSLQTDNHASSSPLSFYRPDALPAAQPTASEHWRMKALRMSVILVIPKKEHVEHFCVQTQWTSKWASCTSWRMLWTV